MSSNCVVLRVTIALVTRLILAACDWAEPIGFAGLTVQVDEQPVFQSHTQQICLALEDAGYTMPYGPPFAWYNFSILQSRLIVKGPGRTFLTVPSDNPYLEVVVNWSIPGDLNVLAVNQQTVDTLAQEAKNICRIVQREAQENGIGPIDVAISMRDLVVEFQIQYGKDAPPIPTSDCDELIGKYIGHSIGLNPVGQTPGKCPSLYVPN